MPQRSPNHYVYLLAGLVLYLVASPVADQYLDTLANMVLDIGLLLPVVVGVWSLRRGRLWLVFGISLTAATVVAQILNLAAFDHALEPLVHGLALVLFVSMVLIALNDVLFGGPIDTNRLFGAVCVYLLLGLVWGLAYALHDVTTPGPVLNNLSVSSTDAYMGGFIYHSFVTLTTLGYGDIIPLTPLARTLTYLEAIFGQLYLTILVAALVGRLLGSSNPLAQQQARR
jgi:hypothetical protein